MQETPKRLRTISRQILVEPEFHQVDMMGVAHNAAYFYWFERGRLMLLEKVLPIPEAVRLALAFPVVLQSCEYLKPASYGDRLVLTTSHELLPCYEGLFTFHHSLINEKTKADIAEAQTDVAALDMRSGRLLRELPNEIWTRYQALE